MGEESVLNGISGSDKEDGSYPESDGVLPPRGTISGQLEILDGRVVFLGSEEDDPDVAVDLGHDRVSFAVGDEQKIAGSVEETESRCYEQIAEGVVGQMDLERTVRGTWPGD